MKKSILFIILKKLKQINTSIYHYQNYKSEQLMFQLKTSARNIERCKQLLTNFQKQGNNLSMQEIHSFIGYVDRYTLRRESYFKQLHKFLEVFSHRISTDAFILKKPIMVAKTSTLYRNLNYFSQQWINTALDQTIKWLQQNKLTNLEEVMPIYQLCIDLGFQSENVRQVCKNILKMLKKQIDINKNNINDGFLNFIVHKHLRVLLSDPNIQKDLVAHLITQLAVAVESNKIQVDSKINYSHTAIVCQLIDIFGFNIKDDSKYKIFLKESFDLYQANIIKKQSIDNTSKNFQRKGQSMFQMRFQKYLGLNGYWFERNKIIGIHQFDVLVKGTLSEEYQPFARITKYHSIEKAEPISQQQLKLYQGITNYWKVQNKSLWQKPILINLNGPFHQIYGQKSGTVRYETIKSVFASKYGYTQYKNIHFKDWESKTPDKQSITNYLRNLFL